MWSWELWYGTLLNGGDIFVVVVLPIFNLICGSSITSTGPLLICTWFLKNPKRKDPFYFCLPALLRIHRNLNQKEFFRSSEGFVRAVLAGYGHPGPLWKIAKMALFNPCMEIWKFFWPNVFFSCTVKVSLSDVFPKVSQAPSKCFSKWTNWITWIISRIPGWIWKIRKGTFFQGSISWNNSMCKFQVWNRSKNGVHWNPFFKIHFSKIKCRSTGGESNLTPRTSRACTRSYIST